MRYESALHALQIQTETILNLIEFRVEVEDYDPIARLTSTVTKMLTDESCKIRLRSLVNRNPPMGIVSEWLTQFVHCLTLVSERYIKSGQGGELWLVMNELLDF